ncbi:MAG: hypothetical protein OEV79_12595 [candidate division WOR-3 bacterium]|nr:hypothetical protein [candidate division WOR-3 bacterium]
MFLDVKGSIKVKTPGYEMNIVKDDIIKDLRSARVKVALIESGDIKWKGSYYAFSWETTSFALAWYEGKLRFNETPEGGIDVAYYVSLRPLQLALLMMLLMASLFHIFAQLGIGVILFLLVFAFLAYTTTYFRVKLWLKGFIRRHIHGLD